MGDHRSVPRLVTEALHTHSHVVIASGHVHVVRVLFRSTGSFDLLTGRARGTCHTRTSHAVQIHRYCKFKERCRPAVSEILDVGYDRSMRRDSPKTTLLPEVLAMFCRASSCRICIAAGLAKIYNAKRYEADQHGLPASDLVCQIHVDLHRRLGA
jgi:hypothetical protein